MKGTEAHLVAEAHGRDERVRKYSLKTAGDNRLAGKPLN